VFVKRNFKYLSIRNVNLIARLFTQLPTLIIYMKKLLDCDWLREVQFKCNAMLHIVIPDYDWLKDNSIFINFLLIGSLVRSSVSFDGCFV